MIDQCAALALLKGELLPQTAAAELVIPQRDSNEADESSTTEHR
jgi:hypothetical protein